MQRIDENTYIDDTLVTDAEYQLFIDEMREQGKYYQPDHWNSYQFPDGKAKEPILGIRYSDARAFCDWLTQREYEQWFYRLPLITEITDCPIKPYLQPLLGYWIEEDDMPQFTLTSHVSENTHTIQRDLASTLEIAFERINASETARIAARVLDEDIEISRDLDHTRKLSSDLDHDIADHIPKDLPFTFPHIPTQELISYIDRIYIRDLDNFGKINIDIVANIARELDNTREQAVDRGNFNLAQILDINLIRAFIIFVDLFTLQERIAGRSLAFEGIRIVKERKK